MRVLLISDWMRGAGGAERYISTLRAGLQAAGDEVRLLTSTAGSAGNGSADYRAYGTERVAAQTVLQIANPFAVAAVRSALRGFQPDVVFLNMFEYHLSPAILHQFRRFPAVLSITDYKCICPIGSKLLPDGRLCEEPAGLVCWRLGCVSLSHWLRDQPRYALFRSGRRRIDRVLACSRWVQHELARNGIEAEFLTLPVPPPGPRFHRAPASEPLFIYCGRLDRNKGLELLLRAFAHLRLVAPTARLRVVGTGPHQRLLERSVDALGLGNAVSFRGWVAPDQVEAELTDGWALVVPSLWAEPLGLVALEAIVRGIPVIASASGGLGEVVDHGISGLLFQNGVEEELVRHLVAVARKQAFPSHVLPHVVVARVREVHSIGRHVDRMQQVFQEVLRSAAATGKISRSPVGATRSAPP
jgi:glycosyltransferase involved in cell wall biosynthesis